MGKGDKKSRRGKIIIGTYGVRRPKNKAKSLENKSDSTEKDIKTKVKKTLPEKKEVKEKKEIKEKAEIKEPKAVKEKKENHAEIKTKAVPKKPSGE